MITFFKGLSRVEKLSAVLTTVFVAAVVVLAIVTDGAVFTQAANAIRGIESKDAQASRNAAINCQDKRNAPLPYCQTRRQELDANWQGIVRNNEGRTNAFSLNQRR